MMNPKILILKYPIVPFFYQDGATPLFKAAHKGHLEVVQELLKHKPDLGILQVSNFQAS